VRTKMVFFGDMGIRALIAEAHNTAKEKGWYDPPKTFGEEIALFHEEISEALREHRNGHEFFEVYWKISFSDRSESTIMSNRRFQELTIRARTTLLEEGRAKPEGIPIELADTLIRIADTCGARNIDLVTALQLKLAYNKTRPFRHDGKTL
jgi:hypothetical protein